MINNIVYVFYWVILHTNGRAQGVFGVYRIFLIYVFPSVLKLLISAFKQLNMESLEATISTANIKLFMWKDI